MGCVRKGDGVGWVVLKARRLEQVEGQFGGVGEDVGSRRSFSGA
jgi:hypothetical protein